MRRKRSECWRICEYFNKIMAEKSVKKTCSDTDATAYVKLPHCVRTSLLRMPENYAMIIHKIIAVVKFWYIGVFPFFKSQLQILIYRAGSTNQNSEIRHCMTGEIASRWNTRYACVKFFDRKPRSKSYGTKPACKAALNYNVKSPKATLDLNFRFSENFTHPQGWISPMRSMDFTRPSGRIS